MKYKNVYTSRVQAQSKTGTRDQGGCCTTYTKLPGRAYTYLTDRQLIDSALHRIPSGLMPWLCTPRSKSKRFLPEQPSHHNGTNTDHVNSNSNTNDGCNTTGLCSNVVPTCSSDISKPVALNHQDDCLNTVDKRYSLDLFCREHCMQGPA